MKVLVVLACACLVAVDGTLAPFITPCHQADSACHKSSAQKAVPLLATGVPALGLAPLDPLHIALVRADQAGLKLEFRDTVVKGLRNCVVLSLSRRSRKQTLELKCSPTLIGDYSISGKLMILPVEGNGKYKIKIRDIVVKVQYEVGEKTVGGDKFWSFGEWKYSSEVRGGAEFQFQNLFNGNKQLSDPVHQFANSNWRDIFAEVAPPVVRSIVSHILDEVRKLFDKVPVKELILD